MRELILAGGVISVYLISGLFGKDKKTVAQYVKQRNSRFKKPRSILKQATTKKNVQNEPVANQIKIFTMKGCGHCDDAKPEFQKLQSMVDPGVLVLVHVVDQETMEKAKESEVKGFPTIQFVASDGSTSEYNGARTATKILEQFNKKK